MKLKGFPVIYVGSFSLGKDPQSWKIRPVYLKSRSLKKSLKLQKIKTERPVFIVTKHEKTNLAVI